MNTAIRLVVFGAALAAVFAVAVGIGAAVGPIGRTATGHGTHPTHGYELRLLGSAPLPGAPAELSFQVVGAGGVQKDYEVSHEKELHLIVVRRDLGTFQHVHPSRDVDGRWTARLAFETAGPHRVFADFVPKGDERAVVASADLDIPGEYRPAARSTTTSASTPDGYRVRLQGELMSGRTSPLTLSVTDPSGLPVVDLEPYLAAYGHLVALRASDLAYLHVHPDGTPNDGRTRPGPDVTFHVEVPTEGRYGLFLDFKHRGQVRTAVFAVDAAAGAPGSTHTGHSE